MVAPARLFDLFANGEFQTFAKQKMVQVCV